MGWSIGYDSNWKRDIGYGVPSTCDHPGCAKEINRGLSYVCGGDAYGGEHGCGLFFCGEHLHHEDRDEDCPPLCQCCADETVPFDPTPDTAEWVAWKLTDESWGPWRDENPDEVAALSDRLADERSELADHIVDANEKVPPDQSALAGAIERPDQTEVDCAVSELSEWLSFWYEAAKPQAYRHERRAA